MSNNNIDTDKLWIEYGKTGDSKIKDQLIIHYAPLVKYIAGRLSVSVGHRVDFDDLVSYGIFGLIDAIDKFDYSKGVKFETYASLRIRGSMIDHIRKLDWVPRTLRQKSKQLDQAIEDLEVLLGREPSEEEIAERLDMTLEETRDLIDETAILSVVSLDDYLGHDQEDTRIKMEKSNVETPEEVYDKIEMENMLEEALNKLTDREKKIVTLYYFEDLTLKEISEIIGVSESRISQIHSKSLLQLQKHLGKYRGLLSI